ncbi:MAG: hypothetical protein ABIA04_07390 [Pseudomonadota bacterium]
MKTSKIIFIILTITFISTSLIYANDSNCNVRTNLQSALDDLWLEHQNRYKTKQELRKEGICDSTIDEVLGAIDQADGDGSDFRVSGIAISGPCGNEVIKVSFTDGESYVRRPNGDVIKYKADGNVAIIPNPLGIAGMKSLGKKMVPILARSCVNLDRTEDAISDLENFPRACPAN